jgi:hypothetical protein
MRYPTCGRHLIAIVLLFAASACGNDYNGFNGPEGPPPLLRSACEDGGWIVPSMQGVADAVDAPLVLITSPRPAIPAELAESGTDAATTVQFVLSRSGRVEACTVVVLEETHASWTAAVLVVLPDLRTTPALVNDQPTRVLAQQRYSLKFEANRARISAVLSRPGA